MSHTFTPSLAGKVVVITGASSGLGEATARHLAARGAKLVLAARRTDKLQSLATELSAAGAEVLTQATDVTHMEQVQALADATLKRFGRIDVLVNNAGIMPLAPLAKLKVDEWSRMIDVNIKGVLHGIAAVLPTMTTQGDGHIINVASVAGHKLFTPIGTVYSATKFAVRVLSEGLRSEAPAGGRTTIISPGAVESELQLGSSDADDAAGVKAFYQANQIPADSVARAIAYATLSSPPMWTSTKSCCAPPCKSSEYRVHRSVDRLLAPPRTFHALVVGCRVVRPPCRQQIANGLHPWQGTAGRMPNACTSRPIHQQHIPHHRCGPGRIHLGRTALRPASAAVLPDPPQPQ